MGYPILLHIQQLSPEFPLIHPLAMYHAPLVVLLQLFQKYPCTSKISTVYLPINSHVSQCTRCLWRLKCRRGEKRHAPQCGCAARLTQVLSRSTFGLADWLTRFTVTRRMLARRLGGGDHYCVVAVAKRKPVEKLHSVSVYGISTGCASQQESRKVHGIYLLIEVSKVSL